MTQDKGALGTLIVHRIHDTTTNTKCSPDIKVHRGGRGKGEGRRGKGRACVGSAK